jgi:hypothetical protein
MVTGVSLTCFTLSYAIALGLELSRHAFKVRYRMGLVVGITAVGLLTQLLYLADLAFSQGTAQVAAGGAERDFVRLVLASWYDWYLIAAFGVAAIYFGLLLSRSDSMVGSFMLPIVLLLIGMSYLARNTAPFDHKTAVSLWVVIHGGSLLVGTMLLSLGFAIGLMFLLQAWRLKSHRVSTKWLRLPSLEYLETLGRWCLYTSAVAVLVGLASGVVINLQRNGKVGWTEGGILFSGCLAGWLAFASAIQMRVRGPANGRWTAWLNLASFLALLLAIVFVIWTPHGRNTGESQPNSYDPAQAIRLRSSETQGVS